MFEGGVSPLRRISRVARVLAELVECFYRTINRLILLTLHPLLTLT